MSPDTPIDRDLPCVRCRYNLRGLTIIHRCPECEFPVLQSYLFVASGGQRWRQLPNGTLMLSERRTMDVLTALLRCDANAIRFVRTCIHQGSERQGTGSGGRPVVSAKEVCDAVPKLALVYFGDVSGARAGLRDWGLARSEDVGRIFAALVEAGLVSPPEGGSPSDFRGVFELDTLFPGTTEQE